MANLVNPVYALGLLFAAGYEFIGYKILVYMVHSENEFEKQ